MFCNHIDKDIPLCDEGDGRDENEVHRAGIPADLQNNPDTGTIPLRARQDLNTTGKGPVHEHPAANLLFHRP